MKTVTATELRSNIYSLLDEVLATGVPLEIQKGNKRLRITAVEPVDKLQNLVERPQIIVGNPDELVSINWEKEINAIVTEATSITWTRDPFDRIIVANAALHQNILLSKDHNILTHYPLAKWEADA